MRPSRKVCEISVAGDLPSVDGSKDNKQIPLRPQSGRKQRSPADVDRAPQLFENRIAMLNRKQLAEQLNLSPSYISKLMAEDGLPYYKIGRSVRFKVSEVMVFLQERKRP